MKEEHTYNTIVDQYYRLLENLNDSSKQELISRLSSSVNSKKRKKNSAQSLFGAFSAHQTAETIIRTIKKARKFSRTVEKL